MNNSKTTKIDIRSVYGIDKMYPACSTSLLLAKLTDSKTFSPTQLQTIKALGYTIEVIIPTWRKN